MEINFSYVLKTCVLLGQLGKLKLQRVAGLGKCNLSVLCFSIPPL